MMTNTSTTKDEMKRNNKFVFIKYIPPKALIVASPYRKSKHPKHLEASLTEMFVNIFYKSPKS